MTNASVGFAQIDLVEQDPSTRQAAVNGIFFFRNAFRKSQALTVEFGFCFSCDTIPIGCNKYI